MNIIFVDEWSNMQDVAHGEYATHNEEVYLDPREACAIKHELDQHESAHDKKQMIKS